MPTHRVSKLKNKIGSLRDWKYRAPCFMFKSLLTVHAALQKTLKSCLPGRHGITAANNAWHARLHNIFLASASAANIRAQPCDVSLSEIGKSMLCKLWIPVVAKLGDSCAMLVRAGAGLTCVRGESRVICLKLMLGQTVSY